MFIVQEHHIMLPEDISTFKIIIFIRKPYERIVKLNV